MLEKSYELDKDLKYRKDMLEVSKWELFEARKSSLPSVSMELSNRTIDTTNAKNTASPSSDQEPFFSVDVSAPLSFNGLISENINLYKMKDNLNILYVKQRKEQIMYNTLILYIDTWKKMRLYEISKEIMYKTKALTDIFENVYKMGKSNRLEYINSMKELYKLEYQTALTEGLFKDSYYELLKKTGLPEEESPEFEDIRVDYDLFNKIEVDTEIKKALKNKIDVQIFKDEKKISKSENRITEPDQKMFLNFEYNRGASYDSSASEFSFPLDKKGHKYSLVFEKPFSWHRLKVSRDFEEIGKRPDNNYLEDSVLITDKLKFDLFENGTDKSTVFKSRVERDYSVYKYEEFIRWLKNDIKNSISSIKSAGKAIKIQQKSVSLYDEKIEIEEKMYKMGRLSMPELLESHVESLKEKEKYVEALFEYKKGLITLKYHTGDINEYF